MNHNTNKNWKKHNHKEKRPLELANDKAKVENEPLKKHRLTYAIGLRFFIATVTAMQQSHTLKKNTEKLATGVKAWRNLKNYMAKVY